MTPEQLAQARQIVADAADNQTEYEQAPSQDGKSYEIYEDTKLELADRAFALLEQLTRS